MKLYLADSNFVFQLNMVNTELEHKKASIKMQTDELGG